MQVPQGVKARGAGKIFLPAVLFLQSHRVHGGEGGRWPRVSFGV